MKLLYSFLTILLFSSYHSSSGYGQVTTSTVTGNGQKWIDISYSDVSPMQKLNIFLPESGTVPYPVIVAIHGGAFMMGDKGDNQANAALTGLKRGYAVVSVNYRLSGEALFPANIHDVKAAIRWIRANSGKYQLNPDKIATWGNSAGGYLSALAGTSGNMSELEDLSLGNPDFSSSVQAVIDWYGPIDFLTMDEQFIKSAKGKPDHGQANSPESRLMGRKISEIPDAVRKANPSVYISKDDPPFFIQHGKEDQLVPVEQSINFAEDLLKILDKERVNLILLENTKHGGPQFETEDNLGSVFEFLDNYLK